MDGYRHLSIAEREDIMVRRKDREGISQIARELGRDKSTVSREIRSNGWRGLPGGGTAHRPRRGARPAGGCAAVAPGSWATRRGAPRSRCRRGRALVPGPDIRPHHDGAARASTAPCIRGPSTASFQGTGRRPCRSGARGLPRAQDQGALRPRRATRRARGSRLLLPSPPPLRVRNQREHQRAPQGPVPEGREPRRRHRRRSPKGVRFAQPETAQASGMEVPRGGLPSPIAALIPRIRPAKMGI